MWVFFFRGQLWTVAVGSAKGFSDGQKSLLESATSQSGSWNFSVVLGQRFQHSLEDQFTMYISHLQHWLSGGRWVSAIFFGGCLYMGARARGRVAFSSPLALQPVASPVRVHLHLIVAFFHGFCTAFVIFIWWLSE